MIFNQKENNRYRIICQEIAIENDPLQLKATYQVKKFLKRRNRLILIQQKTFKQIDTANFYFQRIKNEMIS